ncbi:GNAT family N-acetyltransferase [Parvibaculum sp.]|uniref:GNAT family N-acetyltransferase n=1 Tax=Parvibaculum sp. TaxID=2024848 RepID=UPI000C8BACFD|nr:GNAT family N-acetyltransferase [Parvibaculum sp.]MAB13524.1 GNAT family N-acetyltransferase [Parvibaculum sp.]
MPIETARTRLRQWREPDRDAFAALNAHPEVMHDLGGPIDRRSSDEKFDRYVMAYETHGFTRWAIETFAGNFLGYAGIMPSRPGHPLGPHTEIGWRLQREAWGHGYATEAASAALADGFARCGLTKVLAYTAPDNLRSQAVMERLGLIRVPSLDYEEPHNGGMWRGLVWIATASPSFDT